MIDIYLPKPQRFEAIVALVGGSVSQILGGEIIYNDGQTPPSESAINTKLAEMVAEYEGNEYARNRAKEYPSVEELTVALYDPDDKATVDAKRAAVKTKWPKDNSGPVE